MSEFVVIPVFCDCTEPGAVFLAEHDPPPWFLDENGQTRDRRALRCPLCGGTGRKYIKVTRMEAARHAVANGWVT